MVPFKDQLLLINISDISCFYTSDKNTFIYLTNGQKYSYSKSLEQIATTLNPDQFNRANKQFIVSRERVKNITIWFDNRLLITLDTKVPERIFISKNKASEFKNWIVKK
nr:LytTR family DNA-binding domain-containing protein [Carboxylicivirga linearis]